jgi:hypothetical protein
MSISSKIALAMSADGASFEEVHTSLEKITEEFAIEFADWCKQEYDVENTAYHNKWLDVDGKYVSTKELLEIYKKEKGL